MKRFTCIVSSVLAAALTVACPWHEAAAQIDIGIYFILANSEPHWTGGVRSGGDSNREPWTQLSEQRYSPVERHGVVGLIDVPHRDPGAASYSETWVIAPEYLASPDLILEIVPALASASSTEAIRGRGARRLKIQARERDLAAGDILADAGDAGADEIAYVKEVWQCVPAELRCDADSFELVGLLYALASDSDALPQQTWLLSDRYVYPSPQNGIRTQLRPILSANTLTVAALVAEASQHMSIRRSIRVDLADSGEFEAGDAGETPSAACSYGGAATGTPYLVLVGVIASSALARRRVRRRTRR